jgi:hypothetical protein
VSLVEDGGVHAREVGPGAIEEILDLLLARLGVVEAHHPARLLDGEAHELDQGVAARDLAGRVAPMPSATPMAQTRAS